MPGIEGQRPIFRKEAPPYDTSQGGQTPPGRDRVRLTPEPAESHFAYPLKPIAQQCLVDIRDYEELDYGVLGNMEENIQKDIQGRVDFLWERNPPSCSPSFLGRELREGFNFPRVAIPYMLVHDHPFSQGRNEQERWTERDKRYLLDEVLVEDSVYCQEQLDYDAQMKLYFPEIYLDPDDKRWNERDTRGYHLQLSTEDLEMYQRSLRVNRQLLRQLRQRGEAPPPRKVIPLR